MKASVLLCPHQDNDDKVYQFFSFFSLFSEIYIILLFTKDSFMWDIFYLGQDLYLER